ncbi:MAG: hypothetical protein QNJ20_02500 [Paracoccaceae bacterium]|nr:hypothetical protein [Paracoccaceae bacterium]
MSDPVTNAEIEDVLSSIRRLVSEEPLGERASRRDQGDNTGKLVLTPALRVAEAEEQDDHAPEANAENTPGPDALEFHERSGEEATAEAGVIEAADEEMAADDVDVAPAAEDDTEDEPAHEAHPEEPTLERQRPMGVLSEDAESTLQRRVAELEAALQMVPDEWEPDGSETELSDETEPLSLEAALSDDIDETAEVETDAGEPDEIDAIAELIDGGEVAESGDDTPWSDAAEELTQAARSENEPAEGRFTLVETARVEDGSTEDLDASGATEPDPPEEGGNLAEAPTEAAVEADTEKTAPLDDAAIDAMFEDVRAEEPAANTAAPEAPMAEMVEDSGAEAAPVEALFGDVEASIVDRQSDQASPVAGTVDEPAAENAGPAVEDPSSTEEPIARPETSVDEDPVPESADDEEAAEAADDQVDEPAETLFEFGADETLLDEEALREMVSTLVRDELQGVLGERITRNVRRLVRREIQRAMALRDLE